MAEVYDTIRVAITAEHYDGSLPDALIAALGDAVEHGDSRICAALDIDTYADCTTYEEDELLPDDPVDDDFAVEQDDGYTIAQVKVADTKETVGGQPKPVHQVDQFEEAVRKHQETVTAKYTLVGHLEHGQPEAIEQLFDAGRIDRCILTCTVTEIPIQDQTGLEAAMDATGFYLKDGTTVRPSVWLIPRSCFARWLRGTDLRPPHTGTRPYTRDIRNWRIRSTSPGCSASYRHSSDACAAHPSRRWNVIVWLPMESLITNVSVTLNVSASRFSIISSSHSCSPLSAYSTSTLGRVWYTGISPVMVAFTVVSARVTSTSIRAV